MLRTNNCNPPAVLNVQPVGVVTRGGDRREEPEQFQKFEFSLTPCKALRRLGAVTVRMDALLVTDDYHRRFYPGDGVWRFVKQAARCGFALIAQRDRYDRRRREEQCIALEAFLGAPRLQEFFRLRLISPAGMTVRRAYQREMGRADLLPEDLGRNRSNGRRWSLAMLLDEGRAAAERDDWLACDERQAMVYGWCRAALRMPLSGETTEIASALRRAMFDSSEASERLTEAQMVAFQNRFRELASQQIIKMGSLRNLFGGRSNLVRDLASATYIDGTDLRRLGRDVARRGLLDVVWQAHFQVAEAVEEFARLFMQLLPNPLSELERRYFESTFFRQRYLGGLSLLLIAPRCGLLRPLLTALWEDPEDDTHIAALHRALENYAETAPAVREFERLKKRHMPADCEMEGPEEAAVPVEIKSELQDILEHVIERHRIVCKTCGARPHVRPGKFESDMAKIHVDCDQHGTIEDVEVSVIELRIAARTLFEDHQWGAASQFPRKAR